MSIILNELEGTLTASNLKKSSHWIDFLDNKTNYYDIHGEWGACEFKPVLSISTLLKSILNHAGYLLRVTLLRFILDRSIYSAEEYKQSRRLCKMMDKEFDVCTYRHVETLKLLTKFGCLQDNICVIGDGKANMIAPLLFGQKNLKIFSVNLSEVLINDYLILKKYKLISDDEIMVVQSEEDLHVSNKKLFLIDASKATLLKDKGIKLFVNIASMQEMKPGIVSEYFDIIKSNHAYFYCCNREKKVLMGGEELIFDQYPWGSCDKLLYESCPWHQKCVRTRPPFIIPYDGHHMHALVKYA